MGRIARNEQGRSGWYQERGRLTAISTGNGCRNRGWQTPVLHDRDGKRDPIHADTARLRAGRGSEVGKVEAIDLIQQPEHFVRARAIEAHPRGAPRLAVDRG